MSERRHPLEVTVDRLGDHSEKYSERLTGEEKDAIALIRYRLQEIADTLRGDYQ